MRNIPNYIVSDLIKKLPIMIGAIDLKKVDNRTYNAVRIVKKILKRLKEIEEYE